MSDPVHPEYTAPDGEVWRVELGRELQERFEMGAADLPAWHEAFSNQETAWLVLQRLYAVAPLYGVEDAEELVPWSSTRVGEKLGLKPEEVDGHLAEAVTYWRRWRRERAPAPTGEAMAVHGEKVTQERATELLLENGFADVDDEQERRFIAERIVALRPYLESDSMRSMARSVIQQEATIFYVHDVLIAALRARIREMSQRTPKPSLKDESEQLTKAVKNRMDAQSALESSLKAMGLTEMQSGDLRKKTGFTDCVSAMMDAMATYYADESRALIDGMSTAAEIELLLTPLGSLRPAQYRPDLVLMVMQAKDHLWEREWTPTGLNRRVCRKLKAGFDRGLAEMESEEGDVGLIEDEEDSIDEILDEAQPPMLPPSPSEANRNPVALPPRASSGEGETVIIS